MHLINLIIHSFLISEAHILAITWPCFTGSQRPRRPDTSVWVLLSLSLSHFVSISFTIFLSVFLSRSRSQQTLHVHYTYITHFAFLLVLKIDFVSSFLFHAAIKGPCNLVSEHVRQCRPDCMLSPHFLHFVLRRNSILRLSARVYRKVWQGTVSQFLWLIYMGSRIFCLFVRFLHVSSGSQFQVTFRSHDGFDAVGILFRLDIHRGRRHCYKQSQVRDWGNHFQITQKVFSLCLMSMQGGQIRCILFIIVFQNMH